MIKISNLHKRFNTKVIFAGISLEIREGDVFVLLGKSGVGKSVLIKHIVGLIKADQGEIEIDGMSLSTMTPRELELTREKFGILFQEAALMDSLTVEENVGLVLKEKYRLPKAEVKKRVDEVLEQLHLSGTQKLKPADLSGGMKKRVGIARAIITKPKYLFYDEPTAGLDPIMSNVIDNLILQISNQFNITAFVITHDLQSLFKIATKVTLLDEGKTVFVGTLDELKQSNSEIVKSFIFGRKA